MLAAKNSGGSPVFVLIWMLNRSTRVMAVANDITRMTDSNISLLEMATDSGV
jgi:hypothetical protein